MNPAAILSNAGKKTLSQTALEIAITQLGVTEDKAHTNKGDSIKYQEAVGLGSKGGYAWCAAFTYWCYLQASKQLGVTNPVVKTGGVLDRWNRTDKTKKVTKEQVMKNQVAITPGSEFVMKYSSTTGHIGVVERMEGDNIYTIEGNTNDESSRDGYEVCRRVRKMSDPKLIGFIKY
jgi:hypothetical protein